MNRRKLLLNVLALSLTTAGPSQAGQVRFENRSEILHPAERLIRILPRRHEASIVGNAIIKELPHHKNAFFLVRQLMAGLALPHHLVLWPSCVELRRRFNIKVSQDFRLGKLTLVDGWMLAESEGQLFSLVALAEARQMITRLDV